MTEERENRGKREHSSLRRGLEELEARGRQKGMQVVGEAQR